MKLSTARWLALSIVLLIWANVLVYSLLIKPYPNMPIKPMPGSVVTPYLYPEPSWVNPSSR